MFHTITYVLNKPSKIDVYKRQVFRSLQISRIRRVVWMDERKIIQMIFEWKPLQTKMKGIIPRKRWRDNV